MRVEEGVLLRRLLVTGHHDVDRLAQAGTLISGPQRQWTALTNQTQQVGWDRDVEKVDDGDLCWAGFAELSS